MVQVPPDSFSKNTVLGTAQIDWTAGAPNLYLKVYSTDLPDVVILQENQLTYTYNSSDGGDLGLELWQQGAASQFQTTNIPTPDVKPDGSIKWSLEYGTYSTVDVTNTYIPGAKTLTGLTINFFTGQENKDPTTEIDATLKKSDGTVVARYGQALIDTAPGTPGVEAPSEFPAWQTTTKQMALQQATFTNSDTTGLTLTITITPHGSGPIPIPHDTWTFTWQLVPEWNHTAGSAVTAPAYWSLDEHQTSASGPVTLT